MTPTRDDVTIRELSTLAEYQACVALQEATWGQGFSERVPGAILRVGQKIGGVTAGAFDHAGRMVGMVFGLTGVRHGRLVHWSDMLAVVPDWRNRNLGERLKHYQADEVRARGVTAMLWTFDPLVARNAHFNINKLGAYPVEYVEDMYGSSTGSVLHGALPTDRFVAEWNLLEAVPAAPGADIATAADDQAPLWDLPLATMAPPDATMDPYAAGGTPHIRVRVPQDFSALQAADPSCASRWRFAFRAVATSLLGQDYRVTRFVRSGPASPYYVFSR